MSARAAVSLVAGSVLAWSLLLPLVRPHVFDHASMAAFVVEGCLVAFAGVALVSQNQQTLLAPIRAIRHRSADNALAARLAIAYPVGKQFRTSATLVMYTLVTLVLVLLVEIAGVLDNSIETKVAQATAGYDLRVEMNPASASRTLAALRHDDMAGVAHVTTLTTASALTTDPGHRTDRMLSAVATGVHPDAVTNMTFDNRLPGIPTDAGVWRLIASDPRYVAIDTFYGASGGPNGQYYSPGDRFVMTNAQSGISQTKIIAGILTSSMIFYPDVTSGSVFPVVESVRAVDAQFGSTAENATGLVRLRGVEPETAAGILQSQYLRAGLVATAVGPAVRRMFSANIAFFRLMQGFLALGLVVGIAGLGVIMIRAVRERRRTIGVLRALGVQARTMRRSFLLESGLIAVEGVLLGSILGVLTTWLMYQKSATFETVRTGFPVEWITIAVLLTATLVLSLIATVVPARRASRIVPALAVRIAD
jgi:putative ABC transport system permease protein